MTIDKNFLSNLNHYDDEQDEYKRSDLIQIGFEQELKSLTVHYGDSARFEAKISACKSIDRSLLNIEWRVNDVCITNENSKYQFGCLQEENRYWMIIQQCQQQDEKVYTIYISYDNGRLHDESSAYLFVDNVPTEKESNPSNSWSSITSLNRFIPPTITRSLQSTYRYHPGEQLHFLVEYVSPSTEQCHSTWQVQYSNDKISRSIENGLIVNADCSSILIIESITSELQGLYTFYVENIYGRAMTQTIVIVNTNDLDDNNIQKYQEIEEYQNGKSNHKNISIIHDISSSESSEYEDVKVHTYSSINGKQTHEQIQIDVSNVKDLYGQRHITYFDPSFKFEHVESIEQFENEDVNTQIAINGHQMKNGHDSKGRITFELPPPPPIDDTLDEHIYEDIPNIVSIPQNSTTTSVQQQSTQITNKDFNTTEQIQGISSSPNSLDEVLNHVEQWSDIIVDNDSLIPTSPRQISKISHLIPSANEYVDEEYINHHSHVTSVYYSEASQLFEDEDDLTELYEQSDDQIEVQSVIASRIMTQQESISTYLSNDIDQVIEKIHLDDELFEAKKTFITGIQAPNIELSSLNQLDNDSLTEEISSIYVIEKEFSMPIVHKTEESLEILNSKIVDYIDIPSSKTHSDDQKPEAIIVTTEEISSIYSPDYFPMSNVKIESVQTIQNPAIHEQPSIISLTIINEKLPGESLESLSVPVHTDLLPLATMPDQTTNTDEQRIPDRTVQDVLSASLEPTKINHIEGIVEMIPMISFASIEKVKDHEEFFDIESEKPPITLAVAEKLQHDAAIEQKDEDFVEPELDLTIPITVEPSLKKNDIENVSEEKSVDQIEFNKKLKPINKKKTMVSRNSIEKNEEQTTIQKLKSVDKQKSTETILDKSQITTTSINQTASAESSNEEDKIAGKKIESFSQTSKQLSVSHQESSSNASIAQIDQEFLRPKFSFRLKPTITINDGDNLKLEVHFIGQPKPKVTWYFKSDILKPSSNIHIDQSRDIHTYCSILTINKINPDYDGKFKVIIKNDLGEAVSVAQVNIKRASISVQLHTPAKKTSVGKMSTPPIANDKNRLSFSGVSGGEAEIMSTESPNLTGRRRSSTLVIPEGKPTFSQPLESELYINEDDQLTLECIITGNPLPELIWLFNERKIVFEDGHDKKTETLNPHTVRHQLIISSKHKKLGIYKAQGQNNFGHTISTCHVKKSAHTIDQRKKAAFEETELSLPTPPIQRRRSSATTPPVQRRRSSAVALTPEEIQQITQKPIIIEGLSKLKIDLGSPCALTCKSKYDSEQMWIKDGKPIVGTTSNEGNVFTKVERSNDNNNTHILNIKQFKQENCGNYELILKNPLGEVHSKGQLEMKGIPPTFTVEPESTAAVKGKTAEFNCRIEGSPKPEVQWFLNGQILRSGSRITIGEERGLIVLRINNTTDNDRGTIKCVVKNSLAEISREVKLEITGEQRSPKIIEKSKSVEVNAGESVEFFVKIEGSPPPTVTWTRKGMTITSNDLYQLRNDNNMYYLLIKKAIADVIGTYVITASNVSGKTSTEIDLNIAGLSTLFERPLRDTSVTQGRPLTLDCELNVKNGIPTIIWMKNNEPIPKSDRIVPSVKGNKVHVLTIKQAVPSDAGYYSVKATLGNETSISDAQVIIEVAPTFVKIPETVTVVDGQDCEINVEIYGLPPPNVVWSYLAEDLTTNAKYKITSDGKRHQLRIQHATAQDAGEYQIICSNNLGRITGKINVRISSPPVIVQPLKDLLIPIKRIARLETQIYAFPEPKIIWSKDAIPIDFNSYTPGKINAEERRGTYALSIKNIQLEDGGFYVCTAQNPLGTTKTSATLTIEVAPVFLEKLEKLEGVENCDIDIRFQVAGYPKPKLDFSFNQKPIELKGRYSLKELKDGWYVFIITNAQTSDAGSYSCIATNSLGQASSVGKLTLFPLAPPNFTKNLTDAIFPVGGILKAELRVTGLPVPRLTWLKNGQVFDENERISIVYDSQSGAWTLIIRDCQESDTGVYECRAKNPGGEKITKATITVSGEAASFIDTPEKITCLEGQIAVFGCRVAGDPYPLVVWSKGKAKQFTENTPKYALYYDDDLDAHFFEINQCSEADAGTYTVTLQNVHGTLSKTVSCIIVTKPEEVIDYKSILRKMEALAREREPGPDWGKLRKGKGKPKGPGDPGWQYQLKHFELTGDAQLKKYNKGEGGDLIGLSPSDFSGRRSRSGTGTGNDLEGDDGLGLGGLKPVSGKDRRSSRLGLVTFTKPLSNITVHEGKNAAFECNVSDDSAPVTWYINDQPVPTQRAQTLSIGKVRRLVLKDCQLNENDSKITCALDEATKTNAQLFVKEEPFDFTEKLKNLKIKRGDKCELQCAVNKPNIALQWFKDGKPITDIKEQVDGLTHKLIIPKTEDKDKGVYVAKYQDAQTEGHVEILGPPQIIKPPTDSILILGQSVVLTAEIIGSPKPQVTWLFKGQPLTPKTTKHQMDAKKDGIYTLTILKGEPADEGQYTVVAENPVDRVQAHAKVTVCTKPKIDKLTDVAVNIGENARIQCQYSGNPTPTITWYKDGKPISNTDQRFIITQETPILSTLTINNTNMDDKGVYSVKLTNIAGDVEGKANLTIKPIKPTITRDLDTSYTGTKGEDLILSISGTGNPHPTCQWFKNNTELTTTTDTRIQFKEDKATNEYFLIIKNANQDDMGEYQAQLTNIAGLIKSKKSKIIVQKQPTFIKKPQSITVNQTDTGKMECQIDALPQAKVTWLVSGKPVSSKDGYETTFDTKTGIATLIIKNITTKHAGPITVRAENTAGTAEETADINVRSAPILLKPLTDTEVVTNHDATFTCEFQSSPQATVKWFCNGKPVTPTPNKYDISYDTKTNQHKLIIKNTTLNDNGNYSAQASNELGQIQTQAKLNVINAPEFISGLKDKTVIEKETIELLVKVSGTPQPTLTWLKAGKEIKPDEKKYSILPIDKEGNAKLIIKDISEDDQALYSCVAKNKVGTYQTDGHLKVTAPLKFIQPLQDTDVLNTQNATLTCEVQGIPKANIKWFFNDVELKSTQKQTISSKQNVHSLTINRADQTDAGIYKAVADNGTGKTVETACTLTVGSKPKVEGKPTDVTVNVEQPAVLECTFSGFPKPEVTWFKDNVPLKPDQRVKIHEDKPNVHSLKISRSQLDDKATYTCKAKNRFGEVEAKMNLTVNSIKPTIIRDLQDQEIIEKGKPLKLEVEITGLPQPQVKWYKGNDEITGKDYQITFDNKQTYTLIVPNCTPDHQAEYSVQATNPGGTVKSKKTKVIVQKKPEFIKLPQSQTVKEGQPVVFDAQIDAYPQPKVTWLKNGKPLTPDLGFESQFDVKTGQITLKHKGATPKQAGELICRVENSAGTTDAPVTLDVHTAPVITKKLTDQEIMIDNEIRFVVDITGSPSPKVSWTKDDVPIKPDANHIIETDGITHTLIIKNAKATDEGKYRVVAENPLGRVESNGLLTILEHPLVDQPFGDVTKPVGSDVNLKCKIIGGRPKATITWLKNGKEFKPDDRHKITSLPDGTCELSIKSLDETDNQDKYTLLIKNKVGQKEINSTITVKAPLEFIQPLKDQDIISQSSCTLTVETNGIPKPTVKWFFNDQEIKNTPKTKIESKQNLHTLTIPKTELTDEGVYKCIATNPDGTIETKAKISVCTKPKIDGKVNDVTVQITESAELRTKFSAIPKPTVTWYKGNDLNTPLKPNDNIEISELPDGTSVLKIKKTDLTDSSPYIARAVNKVGEIDSKINLTVKEIKPTILSDITNVTATRDEQAQFSIKATGNPQPTIRWFKNDTEEILPTDKNFQIIHDKPNDTFILKINKCKPEHQGDYSAIITNSGGAIKSKKGKLTVTKSPEFLEKPTSININENQLAEFHTKIDAYPAPKITWLFDGKPVTPKEGFDVQTDQTNGTSVLTIKQVTPKHDGKITVKAENPAGSIEETVQCSVKTAPKITKKPIDTEALIHTDAVFTVDVSGSPKPQVEWIHGTKPIKPSKKYEIIEETPTTSKLIIHDVTPEDELPIQIKVKNPLGETDTTVQLKVLETPRIEPQLTDQQVKLNQPLVLKANVYGRPKVDIQWLKDQKPLTPSEHIKIERKGDECILTIPNIKEEDIGAYTLSVKNKVGKIDSTANVNVTAPLKFQNQLNDLDIIQGSNGTLTVECEGVPKPKLTWYFNENEIKPNQKTRIDTKGPTSTLTINKADMPDIGVYKVVADNGKERIETHANVDVCVKPKVEGKPSDVTCLLTETAKLNVKFSAIPKPTITWHKPDGTEVKPDARIQIINDDNGQSTLIINDTTSQDSQPYIARATNKVGSVDAKVNLTVKEVKPSLKNDLESQTINVGDELVYRLIVDGRPTPVVKFYKDGNEVGPVTIEKPTKPGDTTVTAVFRIPKATINDQGEYQASVENPAGVVKTKKAKVTVQQVPVFLKAPQDQSVSQGKDVTYEAQLSAFPIPKITWLLNGKPLTPNADCSINFDTPTQKASLTLRKVDADKHAGIITCQVENPAGKITHDVKLDVRTQPKISKPLKDESIIQGQDVTLSIEASGNPSPKPEWYFNDKPIPINDQHYQIITPKEGGNLYELKIKQTKPTDEGTYKVVMKNSEGEIVSQAKLNVHTPPVIGSVPPKIEAVQGQQVIIPCKVSGHPKPEITFLKDKKDVTTLEDKARFRIEENDKTGEVRLIISDVKEEDQGKYTIRAKNPAQTVEENTNLIVTAPLAFIDKLKDTDVISGQNLTLTCRCQGIPKPTIKWFQNDNEIKSTTKQKIESKPDGTQTLTINRVDLTDVGDFKIVVTNPQGTITSTCHVDVLTKPKIDSKPQDIQVNIGETAELNVKLSGVPQPNIQWLKNGQPFNIDNKRIKTIEKDDSCSLIIDKAQLDDKASYTLKATNKAGETESPKINLNVTAIKPTITSDLNKDIIAQTGETIPLTIKVSGTKPKVKWYKNGEEVVQTVEENYEIIEGEETYTLLIKNAKPKNTGEYQAVVTNDVGQAKSKKIKVQVQKAPELKKKPQPFLTVKEGQPAQFECEFDGNPTPKISWLRDGKPLQSKDGYDIKTDTTTGKSVLTINQATPKHAGPITLRLENSVGTPIEEVVQLQVETSPQFLQKPPTTVEAPLNQTATIPFKCSAIPKPTIKLYKNDVQVPLNTDHYELITHPNDVTNYEIKIKNVRPDDEGNYRIRIENPLGNTEANVQVTTIDNISIKPSKPNKTDLKQHETLILEYIVDGKPKPDIIFTKDGKEIKPSPKTQITYDDKTKICRLVTTDVGQDDQGIYQLTAKNKLTEQKTEPIKVTVTAPIVVKRKLPETIDGILGEQTILTVEAQGIPQPKVTWLFNDQPLKTSPKYKIEIPKDNPNQTNLIIPKLDATDEGKYTAIIDNGFEKIQTNTKLNVHTKPQLLTDLNDSKSATTAKIGEKFILEIRAQGKPPPQVIWLFNGQELSTNSKDYELVVTEDGFYRIIFHNFDERYLGEYQAIIKSIGGTIRTRIVRIVGQQAPIFTKAPPKFIQIKTGDKLTIECIVKGHPTPTVTWLRDGKVLSNKDGFDIKVDQNTGHSIFIIPHGTVKHSGKYECKIENQYGTHTAEINIEVLPPPVIQQKLKDFDISRGQEVTITVTANGNPLPSCIWFHNDKQVYPKANRIIMINDGPTHILKLLDVELTDAGTYKAVVESQISTTELISQVTVRDVLDESSVPVEVRISQDGLSTLECQTSGTPLPEVVWTKDGKEIKTSENFILESLPNGTHRLIIKNAQYEHAGRYVANVKHKVRTQFMNFNVTVTEKKQGTSASATINLTGLSSEQQVKQIQTQIRPLFLHFGLQDIPHSLNEILFNISQDKKFQTTQDQLKERERLLTVLANYLYQNSNRQLGNGKKLNWPEVVKIIFYNRFPQIAQTHQIIDVPDGYNVQINDLIQYSK